MISASARQFHALESHFGPPSELIDVSQFIENHVEPPVLETCPADEDFQVTDIRDPISKIWDNPELSAFLLNKHDLAMDEMFRSTKPGAKRVKKIPKAPASSTPDGSESLKALKSCLETIGITSYAYPAEAAYFTRQPKLSDQNALSKIKLTSDGDKPNDLENEALLAISIYTRTNTALSRSSQHAFLSSQTLGDLFESFPCLSNNHPDATSLDGQPFEFPAESSASTGAVMLIEGTLYGDGLNDIDYADKLVNYMKKIDRLPEGVKKSPDSLFDSRLSTLSLRTQEPYWLLHRGNCEHFFVVDQIRMKHDSDPPSGYPLTLQITPVTVDICRGCGRVPAVWSIVGDERMGESPCLLCGPCWRSMGNAPDHPEVHVVPLPRYQIGW